MGPGVSLVLCKSAHDREHRVSKPIMHTDGCALLVAKGRCECQQIRSPRREKVQKPQTQRMHALSVQGNIASATDVRTHLVGVHILCGIHALCQQILGNLQGVLCRGPAHDDGPGGHNRCTGCNCGASAGAQGGRGGQECHGVCWWSADKKASRGVCRGAEVANRGAGGRDKRMNQHQTCNQSSHPRRYRVMFKTPMEKTAPSFPRLHHPRGLHVAGWKASDLLEGSSSDPHIVWGKGSCDTAQRPLIHLCVSSGRRITQVPTPTCYSRVSASRAFVSPVV